MLLEINREDERFFYLSLKFNLFFHTNAVEVKKFCHNILKTFCNLVFIFQLYFILFFSGMGADFYNLDATGAFLIVDFKWMVSFKESILEREREKKERPGMFLPKKVLIFLH